MVGFHLSVCIFIRNLKIIFYLNKIYLYFLKYSLLFTLKSGKIINISQMYLYTRIVIFIFFKDIWFLCYIFIHISRNTTKICNFHNLKSFVCLSQKTVVSKIMTLVLSSDVSVERELLSKSRTVYLLKKARIICITKSIICFDSSCEL